MNFLSVVLFLKCIRILFLLPQAVSSYKMRRLGSIKLGTRNDFSAFLQVLSVFLIYFHRHLFI